MKAIWFCLMIVVLAGFTLTLPLTDARGTTQRAEADSTSNKASTKVGSAPAENKPAKVAADAKANRDTPISTEMEAEVTSFVREHHRELLELLTGLKKNLPQEYERAVRELSRQRHRLNQLEGRDRYASELELWKAQSRARLLAAKVQMDDDEGLRQELRAKLAEIYDLRTAVLERDRERAAERLAKLDEQLKSLRKDRATKLDEQLSTLTKTTQKRTKPVKTSARDAQPASGTKTTVKKLSPKTID